MTTFSSSFDTSVINHSVSVEAVLKDLVRLHAEAAMLRDWLQESIATWEARNPKDDDWEILGYRKAMDTMRGFHPEFMTIIRESRIVHEGTEASNPPASPVMRRALYKARALLSRAVVEAYPSGATV